MDFKLQKDIFNGFFRAGILGYGGGPSSIPLVHREVVDKYRWLTDEEFSDVLALGNTLPGPISTKMAGHIGYRIGGIVGLINAIIATVLPTVFLMILLIGFLIQYRESPIVVGITQFIIPVVGVMLASLAYKFFKQSKLNTGWKVFITLSIISFIWLVLIDLHPAILIVGVMVYSFVPKLGTKKKEEEAKVANL